MSTRYTLLIALKTKNEAQQKYSKRCMDTSRFQVFERFYECEVAMVICRFGFRLALALNRLCDAVLTINAQCVSYMKRATSSVLTVRRQRTFRFVKQI